MSDQFEVYKNYSHQYDALINAEDYQGNLLKEIQTRIDLQNLKVVELGAGTGRITRLLMPFISEIQAFDQSKAMLEIARFHLEKQTNPNWELKVADHRTIPMKNDYADLVISGWSFFYLVTLNWPNWQAPLKEGIDEVLRLLKTHGDFILIESLGTGHSVPHIPGPQLETYYHFLEHRLGFQKSWIRTDYRFQNKKEATEIMGSFFGQDFIDKTLQYVWHESEQGTTVPECTGIWSQSKSKLLKLVDQAF